MSDGSTKPTIPQQYIGQIVGDFEAFVYGAVYSNQNNTGTDQLVYLDMAGSAQALDAIWAHIELGGMLHFSRDDSAAKVVSHADYWLRAKGAGEYQRFRTHNQAARVDHCVLLHRNAVKAPYGATKDYSTFVFVGDKSGAAITKTCQHVAKAVDVPVLEAWHKTLYELGVKRRLIVPCHSLGPVRMVEISLNKTMWTNLICGAVTSGHLTFLGAYNGAISQH